MVERKTDPPSTGPKGPTDPGRGRARAEEYELKIRWERARRVTEVTSSGVQFDFDSPLKVGTRYNVTLTAPGVSIAPTIKVVSCQLALEPGGEKYFRIAARFFP
ncbi:MAG: hypothetical protein ACRD1B_11435 [Thermoanaerobaculia bacterium]